MNRKPFTPFIDNPSGKLPIVRIPRRKLQRAINLLVADKPLFTGTCAIYSVGQAKDVQQEVEGNKIMLMPGSVSMQMEQMRNCLLNQDWKNLANLLANVARNLPKKDANRYLLEHSSYKYFFQALLCSSMPDSVRLLERFFISCLNCSPEKQQLKLLLRELTSVHKIDLEKIKRIKENISKCHPPKSPKEPQPEIDYKDPAALIKFFKVRQAKKLKPKTDAYKESLKARKETNENAEEMRDQEVPDIDDFVNDE